MPADFFVQNLGCKVNRVESDLISATLLKAGGKSVKRDDAQVIVVNTCTVTGEAEMKTRKAIRQALNAKQAPWVIATGCAIAINQGEFEELGARVIAEPNRADALKKSLELLGLAVPDESRFARVGTGFIKRAGVKIQDGCDNHCTYCIVPQARGAGVSTPLEEILAEVVEAQRCGVREIVLTGVNIGCYNDRGASLSALVGELLAATSDLRLRLSSIEPQHTTEDLLSVMKASSGRLCAHLHLPLQSGCDSTLQAMGRLYNTGKFEEIVLQARELMPMLALTTDVIVGFPGENDDEFWQSLEFCQRMAFSKMHVFRYSKRPETPAALNPNQISPQVRAKRAVELRELSREMLQDDLSKRVGTIENVLIERSGRGMSESYHQVEVPVDSEVGTLIPMQFTGYRDTLLLTR